MAKVTITQACGHTATIGVSGRSSDREYAVSREESRDCLDCYTAKMNAAAAQAAKRDNLPALTGSERQVAWATTIRAKALKSLADYRLEELARAEGASPEDLATFEATQARLTKIVRGITNAALRSSSRSAEHGCSARRSSSSSAVRPKPPPRARSFDNDYHVRTRDPRHVRGIPRGHLRMRMRVHRIPNGAER